MIDERQIGRNIRARREELGLTQRTLAETSQISQTQLCGYENAKSTPGLFTLATIANALETTMDELFYGKQNVSFITTAPDVGSVIANSIVALWEYNVIDTYEFDINDYSEIEYILENSILLAENQTAVKRLIDNLNEFENNKDTYADPEGYKKMVKQSVAKEINNYRARVNSTRIPLAKDNL